ncbi:MAG: endonuclease domain-containing protein [Actinomycetota bacterium]|nr:endonuclease domain-containing protein [Actinomycetota bacterium]
MKTCKVCGKPKPLDEFYGNKRRRDGRRPECMSCNLAIRKAKYREDPRKYIERVQRWQRENPERYRAKLREYAESGKKKVADRKSHLKRNYGITVEDYDRMLAEQGGGCAICAKAPRDDIALHVDHDHQTGVVRGLLCFTCNNALGDLNDDPERLYKAVTYLDRDDELTALARARALALTTSR